ncbi:MAG TPA: acyl-CoA dehydrogenase family protein [Candidatus Binatia bacterium]|nr:acyl-CoA dehydrogenase family protein [Candidatus Binatia bacterium]
MADLEKFRVETHKWLTDNAPRSIMGTQLGLGEGNWGGRKATYPNPDMKVWLDTMAERGWTAPEWPNQYGGGGLSKAEAKVLREEMAALKLPAPLVGFGLTMIGPTLLEYGTEEQKREHLAKIIRGEIRWCQGYSEPGSGSDLASLQTRAVLQGDYYVINGQKIWTSYANLSDWMFLLVRTDPNAPKHEGISFILMDMASPGVEARPIKLISGSSPFCETFLTDVLVPAKNVVFKVNHGWTVAKALLNHERTMIASAFGSGTGRRQTIGDFARKYVDFAEDHIVDTALRQRMAQYEMDNLAFKLTTDRARDAAKAGLPPGPESSMFKIYGTELNQRRQELLLSIAGPQALGWEGPGFEEAELSLTRDWLRSRGNTIEGGTSEVQLNIIAKRVLGLPD